MFMKTLCGLASVAKSVQLHVMKIEGSDNFQVVIQPSLELAEKHPALAQPLMITESVDKLEAEVITALTRFTPMLESAKANLEQVQSNLEAAVKAARDKAANKKPPSTPSTATTKPAGTGSNTTNGVKPAAPMQKAADSAPDLFGQAPTNETSQTAPESQELPFTGTDDEEDDNLPDFPGM